MGAREFGLMKSSAEFVNRGRGGTMDEPALVRALQEHRTASAGLNVFTMERLPITSPLRELRNVL